MKKCLLIVLLILNSGFLFAEDSWSFRLGTYICSFFKKAELPQINAIHNFDNAAIKEFNVDYKQSYQLWTRCSKLNSLDRWGWWPLSRKDRALLVFARNMALHEEEWKEWFTDQERNRHLVVNVDIGNKELKLRKDFKSPFYEEVFSNQSGYNVLNIRVNEAYHNELQFLQTQLHTMELYWALKQDELAKEKDVDKKKVFKDDYIETHARLEHEIKLFKKPKGRAIFLRSCVNNEDATLLQSVRDAYKMNRRENKS